MGKLYEINMELERLNESMVWMPELNTWCDVDTGEIITNSEYQQRLDKLGLDKHSILEYLAKCVLNERAEIESLKAEINRLNERKKNKERLVERFLTILDRECAGERTDLGVATMSYRKSEAVEWEPINEPNLIDWLEKNGHDECLKFNVPEVRKTELKALIKGGVEVPGASIVQRNNASLK